METIRNLIFEGEGVRCAAYAGAMLALKELGVLPNIRRVGGTSAGAIAALMVGLRIPPEQMAAFLYKLDFNVLRDRSMRREQDIFRLVTKYGWYRGKNLHDLAREIVKLATGSPHTTFAEARLSRSFLDMYFIGANLSTHFAQVYSFEHTPGMRIADAVRISASIPFLFASRKGGNGDILVDGGILDAYPVRLFDRKRYVRKHFRLTKYYEDWNGGARQKGERRNLEFVFNEETLGFRLDSKKEIAVFRDGEEPEHNRIDNFVDFTWHLIMTLLNAQNQRHLDSDDWQRTVYIETCGVKPFDFRLSDEKKQQLIQAGYEDTYAYFDWLQNSKKE